MTALERIIEKGYNPFFVKTITIDNINIEIDPKTEKIITIWKWSKDGYKHEILY